MRIFDTQLQLTNHLKTIKKIDFKIGLVPTMGALHEGHLSLIKKTKQTCELTIVSIFVNPTQFNNKEDLLKYPKPIAHDIAMLEMVGCDVLFNPEIEEVYRTENEVWDYEIGDLNHILEGRFRPGHYLGVTQIVFKLFDLIKPDIAFFGQKDYQQYLVIKKMVADFNLNIDVVACPIIRESDGLAMSSRNIRLSHDERNKALIINKSLTFLKENYTKKNLEQLKTEASSLYLGLEGVELEYLTICKQGSLQEINAENDKNDAIALVACIVGSTRLIDNMMLS